MELATDKHIWHDKKRVLIKKGTKVNIICWHDDVAICEYNLMTFSARKEQLK